MQKSLLLPGKAGCSREAQYQGKQAKASSPGKRAAPDGAPGHPARQGDAPAKRPKRGPHSKADGQPQHAAPSSAPGGKHELHAAPGRIGQQWASRDDVMEGSEGGKPILQPANVPHLRSEANVRNSQETICAQIHSSPATSGNVAHNHSSYMQDHAGYGSAVVQRIVTLPQVCAYEKP